MHSIEKEGTTEKTDPEESASASLRRMPSALVLLALLTILIVAAFLRTYSLESAPPGLSPDVAANGIDAIEILQGKLSPFMERNGGREPFIMYLIALVFRILGVSGWAILFTSALVGVATILVTFLLSRKLFGSSFLALLVSSWLTISYWHVNFSRSGLRATTLPLLISIAAYLLWKGLLQEDRKKSYLWFGLSGLALGLSLYTYLPARFFPIVFGLFFILLLFRQYKSSLLQPSVDQFPEGEAPSQTPSLPAHSTGKTSPPHSQPGRALALSNNAPGERGATVDWLGAFILVFAASIAFLPLGLYFFANPDSFTGRANEVSIFNEAYNGGNVLFAWLGGLGKTIGMFFVYGDGNWRHNFPYRPIFDPLTSILFLTGLLIAIGRRNKPEYLFSLLWLVIMLLPATLTAEGMPNSLRTMGLLPVMYFFPAIAASWLKDRFLNTQTRAIVLGGTFAVLFFLGAGVTYYTYFDLWNPSQNAKDAVEAEFTPIVQGLNEATRPDAPYIIPVSNALRPGYHHFTLEFLYRGTAPLDFLQVDDASAAQDLASMASGWKKVTLLEWYDTYLVDADPRGVLNFMLDMNGRRIEERPFKGFSLVTYELVDKPDFFLQPRDVTRRHEQFGEGMSLEGFSFGRGLRIDEKGVWVTAIWSSQGQTNKNLKSSLRLQDLQGKTIVQKDSLLLDNSHRYTSGWEPGQEIMDHAYLSAPPSLPDGTYRLAAVIYDPVSMQQFGQQVVLGSIQLSAVSLQ